MPAPGCCANTTPAGFVLAPVVGESFRCAACRRAAASLDRSPTTAGTVVFAGPRERKYQSSRPATTSNRRSSSHTHHARDGAGGPAGSTISSCTVVGGERRRIASSIRRARPRWPRLRSIHASQSFCPCTGIAAKRSRAAGYRSSAAATSGGSSRRVAIKNRSPRSRLCPAQFQAEGAADRKLEEVTKLRLWARIALRERRQSDRARRTVARRAADLARALEGRSVSRSERASSMREEVIAVSRVTLVISIAATIVTATVHDGAGVRDPSRRSRVSGAAAKRA